MLGAIAGDIIGSVYEFNNHRSTKFPLFSKDSFFTDDSVLTIALADSILTRVPYVEKIKEYYVRYPHAGYGGRFRQWAKSSDTKPYGSFGNGSAMRVSPAGWAHDSLEGALDAARQSAAVTHNHPEGIKGAEATAACIFLGRQRKSKIDIRAFVEENYYPLNFSLEELRRTYRFNETCQETVPQAIFTFLESQDFEHSIRLAVSIGGDTDTLACINGSIAEAFYCGVPVGIRKEIFTRLDPELSDVTNEFVKRFRIPMP